ncbi:diguanylate cyclase [Actinoplanes sp. SE50]|uniref:putative bifunctional diguanylate cyclase/phosphodiesterase n=1 Tax=unclassified Actinoplanes TaxID=2626549 RepID=UPI00023ED279|nr:MULTISPECIES: bifunctional diguanylate cyclase/phosphodiesterase [unclassified Actinoplanes]AEV85577.1 putative signaling protein [Actinoplanes sp. SE50/110]ATO83970.1 diguanylate cyclase [Actinoplanes sp. SE50]SLM01380.1 diguanylate cyclase [Actinoplanes sp. SE50/110]
MRLKSRSTRAARLLVAAAGLWLLAGVVFGVAGVCMPVPVWGLWPIGVASVATQVVAALLAAATGVGACRLFWRRLSIAFTLLGLAVISQTRDAVQHPGQVIAMGPLTGALYSAAVCLAVVALVRLPGPVRSRRASVAVWLDIAIVSAAAGMIVVQGLIVLPSPVPDGPLATTLRVIVAAVASAAVLAIVKAGLTGAGAVPRAALWFLTPAGLLGPVSLVLAAAFRSWPHLNSTVAAVLPLGVLITLSAAAQTRANLTCSDTPDTWEAPGEVARRAGISRVPYVAVGATVIMLLAVTLRTGYLPAGLAAGAVVLIVLVLVRQHAALRDNSVLAVRLADQARLDDLTGLPNRRAFVDALQGRTGDTTVAVCDLDAFAALNDRLGDATGDAILRQAAERITLTVGGTALVARLLGDEFGVLLPAGHPLADGDDLATALLHAFQAPLHDLLVTVTVGSAGGRGAAVPDLLRRAELALQAAQRVGANRHQHHTPDLDASAQHHADLAAALRRGLERGEFRLVYQPIVELPLGTLRAVEALVRWHPDGGKPVSPAEFIPVAEQTGMIVELGAWILDTACADAAVWQRRYGAAAPRISVNVSARQLLDPELPALVAAVLDRHGLAPDQVTCEITETAVFAGGPALHTVTALRGLGVGIALDDFGTGHSSLTLLRTCPVTTLKVDKSFIDELNGSPQQEAIAASLSGIATTLGLGAVAEGVETQEQADRLLDLGYRYAQGFHFARPAPAADIDASLLAAVG